MSMNDADARDALARLPRWAQKRVHRGLPRQGQRGLHQGARQQHPGHVRALRPAAGIQRPEDPARGALAGRR